MPEFTIEIDTHSGTAHSAEELERVAALLERDGAALSPALSLNTKTGVIGATFQVEAETPTQASHSAALAFGRALIDAGLGRDAAEDREVGGAISVEEIEARAPVDRILIERISEALDLDPRPAAVA